MQNIGLFEINNRMSDIHEQMMVLSETLNLIGKSMAEGIVEPDDLGWALVGATKNAFNISEEIGKLTESSFQCFLRLEQLAG